MKENIFGGYQPENSDENTEYIPPGGGTGEVSTTDHKSCNKCDRMPKDRICHGYWSRKEGNL